MFFIPERCSFMSSSHKQKRCRIRCTEGRKGERLLMTRIGRRLRGWTNGVLDLPQDLLQEMPRITLIGNKELYIENHRGVLHFSSGQLKLALAKGSLEITGENLVIRNILGQELAVEGIIGEIRYKESEGKS